VILPDSDAFTMDLSDAERVEVLKGPQGALYGKGAIAGAINISTRKPTNEFTADAKASYGSGQTYRLSGGVSGPLADNKLLGRITVSDFSTDGTIINRFDGNGLDYERHSKVSGRLIFTPTDALTLDLRGTFYQQRGSSLWFSLVDVLGTTGGEITPQFARIQPDINGPHTSWRQIYDTSLTASYDTGVGTLSSITAYDDIRVRYREDLDQTPIASVPDTLQTRDTHGYSEELRFTSPGDRALRYIVGGYFQNTKRAVVTGATIDFCYFGIPVPGPCATPMFELSGQPVSLSLNSTAGASKQYAAFAQANYDLTRRLELTLALRYDRVRVSQVDLLSLISNEATFSKAQPKASLAFRATDEAMVYATYSQGFKSGAFNPPPGPGAGFPLVVDNEVSKNYEVGAKTEWLDRRVLLNAAAYYTDYLNPQIFQLDVQSGGQVTINAHKARIQGFELELVARPVPHLDLNASYGYTDSKIKDFDGSALYRGQSLPNMPQSTLNLGLQYGVPLNGERIIKGRLDYYRSGTISYQDFQNNADPNHFLFTPSYYTLDGQIGIDSGRWSLTAYGRNLTEQHFATSAYSRYIASFIFVPFGKDPIQTSPGRIWGAEIRYKY